MILWNSALDMLRKIVLTLGSTIPLIDVYALLLEFRLVRVEIAALRL